MNQVKAKTGKKRFMARPLPFEAYAGKKIAKWEAVAKRRGIDVVDAAGVSPVQEMIYFWNGYKRMRVEHMEGALERLDDYRATAEREAKGEKGWEENLEGDEVLAYYCLRGTVLHRIGRTEEARALLKEKLLGMDLATFKGIIGAQGESWVLPVAHYETAVMDWDEYMGLAVGNDGVEDLERLDKEERQTGEAALKRCAAGVDKVSKWESYDLDARIGIKVRNAQNTLKKRGALA